MCLIIEGSRDLEFFYVSKKVVRRTVNGNSDALRQLIAILTDKGWNLPEMIDAQIIVRETLGWLSLHNLKLDFVLFGYCTNGNGARVALHHLSVKVSLICEWRTHVVRV